MNRIGLLFRCAGFLITLGILAAGARCVFADDNPWIPTEFNDLYPEIQGELQAYQNLIDAQTINYNQTVNVTAELNSANANNGTLLLYSGVLTDVDEELAGLQSLGVKTVTIAMHFPIMYQPYYDWLLANHPTDPVATSGIGASNFINFYTQVLAKIHARGMKVDVEAHVLFTGVITSPGLPYLSDYYASLGLTGYKTARSAMVLTVAENFTPDFLSLQAEPSTEASQSGYAQLAGPSTDYIFVEQMAGNLNANSGSIPGLHTSTLVAAGIFSTDWNNAGYQALLTSYAAASNIDILDAHVYPILDNGLSNLIPIIALAKANNKKTSITEAWLFKVRPSELGTVGNASSLIYGRDPYCFWSPLDQQFMQSLIKTQYYAATQGAPMVLVSFFWDRNFFACLDYYHVPDCPAVPPTTYSNTLCQNGNEEQSDQSTLELANLAAGAPVTATGAGLALLTAGHFLTEISTPAAPASGASYTPSSNTLPLSVAGLTSTGAADDGSNLTYVWTTTGTTPAAVTFSANDSNAAKNTVATFSATGIYNLQCSIQQTGGQQIESQMEAVTIGTVPTVPTTPQPTTGFTNLSSLVVYPNPWRADNNGAIPIKFINLSPGTTIKIFSLSGHFVKSLSESSGIATWDLTNDSGDAVASDLYFFTAKDSAGNKARGKLTIVR